MKVDDKDVRILMLM